MRVPLGLSLCALAACLSTPPVPGSGSGSGSGSGDLPDLAPRLHGRASVGEIAGDGLDSALLWGHDASAGDGSASLFVYRGGRGQTTLDVVPVEFPVATADLDNHPPQWHEPLAATLVGSGPDDTAALVVLAIDTSRPAPATQDPRRFLYLARLTATDLEQKRGPTTHTAGSVRANIGGYVDDDSVFVVQRTLAGAAEAILGTADTAYSTSVPIGNADVPQTLGASPYRTVSNGRAPDLAGIVPLPPGSDGQQDLLTVNFSAAYVSVGPHVAGDALVLGGETAIDASYHGVRTTTVGSDVFAVATDSDDQYFTIVRKRFGAATLDVARVLTTGSASSLGHTSDITDFAIGPMGGSGDIDFVTIDGGELRAYLGVGFGSGARAPSYVTYPLSDMFPGYDVMAVGNFKGNSVRQVLLFDRNNVNQPVVCLWLGSPGTFEVCP